MFLIPFSDVFSMNSDPYARIHQDLERAGAIGQYANVTEYR